MTPAMRGSSRRRPPASPPAILSPMSSTMAARSPATPDTAAPPSTYAPATRLNRGPLRLHPGDRRVRPTQLARLAACDLVADVVDHGGPLDGDVGHRRTAQQDGPGDRPEQGSDTHEPSPDYLGEVTTAGRAGSSVTGQK